MKDFIKLVYQWKIRLMWYFSLGWAEVATPIAVVRDIAVVLTFLKLVLNINFGLRVDIIICIISMGLFILGGFVMKSSGLLAYGNKLSNSANPELALINQIAEKVGVK